MEQEILEKNPTVNVRVYTVWFQMYPTDLRSAWSADSMPDRRVTHRWDDGKVIGQWYAKQIQKIAGKLTPEASGLSGPVPVLWDSWLLYAPDATSLAAQPAGLVKWGRTVLNTRETLRAEVAQIAQGAVSK